MKKRTLLMVLALGLSLMLAVGGTLAYLTDTDDAVNVMTLGNVDIEQLENGDAGFEDGVNLYPAYYTTEKLDWADTTAKGIVNKAVTVENKGTSDAYVRTWFAFEAGNMSFTEFQTYILLNLNEGEESWTWEWDETQTYAIKSQYGEDNYYIAVATLNDKLSKDAEPTKPSLIQLAMSKEAGNDVVSAMGDYYTVLVLTQAMQTVNFEGMDPAEALAIGFGDEKVENGAIGKNHPWDEGFEQDYPVIADTWDGTADTSWYNDTDTEFVITTAEQLAGFAKLVDAGKTFEGKTVKLGKNIDLLATDENGERVSFEPIGSYRNDVAFKGTLDGQGHTISNMSQNTWALDNGYEYNDLGMGLFGKVEDATIKNLVMDNASISGESAICGTVAACAYGDCTFENITVKNSNVADYQYYAGGVVGWASGKHQYIGITVDDSVTIGGQWGDFGNANGGIIGGAGSSATILMKDCTVACRIDAVNDVVSAYQWYCYRNSGMLIGTTNHKATDEAVTDAAAPNLTCENVTVIYGDWANYTYCEFAGTGYPFVRVQAGTSVDAYSNIRYGHPTDAAGNTVVDDNHVHNDGEKHHELIVFDQLYGGNAQQHFCTYGTATHDGVKVIYNNK